MLTDLERETRKECAWGLADRRASLKTLAPLVGGCARKNVRFRAGAGRAPTKEQVVVSVEHFERPQKVELPTLDLARFVREDEPFTSLHFKRSDRTLGRLQNANSEFIPRVCPDDSEALAELVAELRTNPAVFDLEFWLRHLRRLKPTSVQGWMVRALYLAWCSSSCSSMPLT